MNIKDTNLEDESEFGKGFIYNLILFSEHHERLRHYMEMGRKNGSELFNDSNSVHMYFNGASDHLYEIQIPKRFKNKRIGQLVEELQSHAIHIGHGFPDMKTITIEDFYKSNALVRDIAIELDKYFGVEVIEAEWD